MKIEIHILQNFPPSNLNRDDTGSPKDCFFGGTRRARISSQCLKRNVRVSDIFKQHAAENLGVRTKRVPAQLADRLQEHHGVGAEKAQVLAEAMQQELLSLSNEGEAKYLVYIGRDELDELATALAEAQNGIEGDLQAAEKAMQERDAADDKDAKDAAKEALTKARKPVAKAVKPLAKTFVNNHRDHVQAIDIALFGRMLADTPELNIDASSQVAHALSANTVKMEFDYYTAVDDLKEEAQETGAGMIGTVAFNSSTFYRYAVVDLDQLTRNLNGDRDAALDGTQAFLHAFIHTIPSGKQNSFAAHTPPSMVLAVARPEGMPVSLADAFDAPVRPNGHGLIAAAVEALDKHWGALTDAYPLPEGTVVRAKVVEGKGTLDNLAAHQASDVPAVVDELLDEIRGQQSTEVQT